RRALPPPEPPPADIAASQILPPGDLPAPGDPAERPYTLWTPPESMPALRALPTLGHPDDSQDADAPWADLISGAEDQPHDRPWSAIPATTSAPAEPLLWEHSALDGADQPAPEEQAPVWSAIPATTSAPAEPLLWEHSALVGADQPASVEQAPAWATTPGTMS